MPRMFRYVFVLGGLTGLALAIASLAGAYTVQSGDTPISIAKKHGITVPELLKANKGLDPKKIRIGETLTIPGSGGKSDKKATKTTEKASHKTEKAKETPKASKEREKEQPAATKAKAGSHVVQKGETVSGIAAKLGVSTEALLKANKGLDPKRLHVGQELLAPGAAKAEPAAAEPAAKTSRKAEKAPPSAPETKAYTVHKHETPHAVAKKFHIDVKELAKLNPHMGKKLHSGQKLTVPATAAPAAAPARATAARTAAPEEQPDVEIPEPPKAAPAAPVATAPPAEVAVAAPPKPAKVPAPETAVPTLPDSKQSAEAETFFEKGIEFGKQNKFQKAVESFDKAIKSNGNRADYYASRGHAHYYLKQYAKAIDDYTKAIEKNPNFALAYSMRGLSRTRSGHYPQAIEDFNRAIALGPKEADYYKGRGFTYLHLKQAGPMCQDYKKACELGDCELLESARKEKACP